MKLFISYSHKDETACTELRTQLKTLERRGIIATWRDDDITPGQDWREEIRRELDGAEIIILVITENFIASDYCYLTEMAAHWNAMPKVPLASFRLC